MPNVGQHEDGDYILSDDGEIEINEEEGKKDACYHKVKSRYKVWLICICIWSFGKVSKGWRC